MLQKNIRLARYTSFQIGGKSRLFFEYENKQPITDVMPMLASQSDQVFILGGGSNVLISDAGFDGLTLRIKSGGIQVGNKNKIYRDVVVEAGECWDRVVETCINNGLWGIENLSHIPGSAGAAVVQNIGAYGQEISSVISSVEVYDRINECYRSLSSDDCRFSYRKSIFNTTAVDRYLILRIQMALSEKENPQLHYADVEKYFSSRKIDHPTATEIRQAIIAIRNAKFPFPDYINGGNAGSFFKNLKLTEAEYEKVIRRIHDLAGSDFSARLQKSMEKSTAQYKTLPTALLIDALGLKGYNRGGAKINEAQPLVILNTGKATAMDVLTVFSDVRREIFQKLGLIVENEPQLIGFTDMERETAFLL